MVMEASGRTLPHLNGFLACICKTVMSPTGNSVSSHLAGPIVSSHCTWLEEVTRGDATPVAKSSHLDWVETGSPEPGGRVHILDLGCCSEECHLLLPPTSGEGL